jgi:lysophospholipase L1-like esterase
VLLALVAGCSAEVEPPAVLEGVGQRAVEIPGLPGTIDYVALGDSYTAGPFVGTMRVDPEGCARSLQNYPAFLADWLDVATYTDVSCSGADTRALTGDQALFGGGSVGPQLDAVTSETDLVTLGIGGNDFGIYSGLVTCQGPSSAACPQARLRRDAGRLAERIRTAVRQVVRRAPEADVYVVGYPQILPTERACPAVGVGAGRLRILHTISRALNRSLRRGAESAGATYVDLEAASEGHDVCAGDEAWINGPDFQAGVAAPFHPLAEGMRGVAVEVHRAVAGFEPPESGRADPDPDAVVLNDVP